MQMKVVGTGQPIHDARGKATGRLRYTGDLRLPRMVYLAVVFSTIPNGYVKRIDDSKAMELDGVLGVYSAFNTPDYIFNRYRSQFTNKLSQELPLEEHVFAKRVRFVGDRVACVAAKDPEIARKAAALVKVEYDELPYAVTFEDALAGKHCVDGEKAVPDEGWTEAGTHDPDEANGIEVFSHTEISRISHIAMEPHACVADYNPDTGELMIECPTQAVFGIRTVIADMLGMPYNKVRVIKAPMGGSFGSKQEWYQEPVCAVMATILCRPVRLTYSRAEVMRSTCCRGAFRGDLRGVFKKDGTIMRLDMDILFDAGAYMGNGRDYVRAPFGKMFRCYRVPYAKMHSRVVCSNTTPDGAFRSWGVAEYYVMLESLMNKAAEKLGLDPVDIRLKNVLLPGEMDIKMKIPVENTRTQECLQKGRKDFEWDKKIAEDDAFNRENTRYKRGVGVGCAGHTNTYYTRFKDFAAAEGRICDDGSVQMNASIHDHGCGTVEAFLMIASEVLDMPRDRIRLGEADTAVTPYDYGCFSSRSVFVVGRAVQGCAEKLRDKLIDVAAEAMEISAERLSVSKECVVERDNPEHRMTYQEISQWCMLHRREEISAVEHYHNVTNPAVTGTHFAHVEVDTWTGMVRVLDYLALHDIGQAINPAMCIAQTQGAVQMGIGAALREAIEYAPNGNGTNSLAKYHVMNAPDLPEVKVELIESGPSKEGPFGAKSIGEVGMAPVAATIVGAVNNALHSHLEVIPMNPDRILEYLSAREEKKE